MAGGLLRELLEMVIACLLGVFIGISLYFDARPAFDISLWECVLVVLQALLVHDVAHKLAAARLASRGRFRLSPVGAAFSILIALLSNAMTFTIITIKKILGLSLAGAWRLTPYRLLTPGSVVVEGHRGREELGKIAATGPVASLSLGWALLGSSFLLGRRQLRQLALLASAMNAYTALSALLPLAFCDGLAIYWWSRRAWAAILIGSVLLIALSNAILLLGLYL